MRSARWLRGTKVFDSKPERRALKGVGNYPTHPNSTLKDGCVCVHIREFLSVEHVEQLRVNLSLIRYN